MKERPILFSAPMVRAILAGQKTQTRRIVKPQPSPGFDPTVEFYHRALIGKDGEYFPDPVLRYGAADENEDVRFPFGEPMDRLWVKETWGTTSGWDGIKPTDLPIYKVPIRYRADGFQWGGIWRPSLFMRRWMSRITLEIESVRVERLQDITEADAIAEGAEAQFRTVIAHPLGVKDYHMGVSHRAGYANLWNHINDQNGPTSWEGNPWVWVISFRRVTP